jgi:hypothetical protein
MTDEELTPWEQKEKLEELEEELRARGLPSPSDSVWDHGDQNRIVNPMSTPYPPPYDPGPSTKPHEQCRNIVIDDSSWFDHSFFC